MNENKDRMMLLWGNYQLLNAKIVNRLIKQIMICWRNTEQGIFCRVTVDQWSKYSHSWDVSLCLNPINTMACYRNTYVNTHKIHFIVSHCRKFGSGFDQFCFHKKYLISGDVLQYLWIILLKIFVWPTVQTAKMLSLQKSPHTGEANVWHFPLKNDSNDESPNKQPLIFLVNQLINEPTDRFSSPDLQVNNPNCVEMKSSEQHGMTSLI